MPNPKLVYVEWWDTSNYHFNGWKEPDDEFELPLLWACGTIHKTSTRDKLILTCAGNDNNQSMTIIGIPRGAIKGKIHKIKICNYS